MNVPERNQLLAVKLNVVFVIRFLSYYMYLGIGNIDVILNMLNEKENVIFLILKTNFDNDLKYNKEASLCPSTLLSLSFIIRQKMLIQNCYFIKCRIMTIFIECVHLFIP